MNKTVDSNQIIKIGNLLNNQNRPLKERFRALFTLKNIGGPESILQIGKCFSDESALLKHELAYCLGQMQDSQAIPILKTVLDTISENPMVRHEAAEALGAIGSADVTDILKKYSMDSNTEVAETCQIALDRVNWLINNGNNEKDGNPYASVDPSPPSDLKNVDELKTLLLDNDSKLFDRYRAMFSLRNIRTEESVLALSAGLFSGSNLFRHEVAFVLGQLQEPCSVPFLIKSLQNENENEMVRHECAEALGSIATEECIDVLKTYVKDNKQVVRESCEIALDMCEYENSPEFQYANCLQNNNE